MTSQHQDAVERFLAAHQPELAALTLQAYTAAGGHYLALSEADRQQQAVTDAAEFTDALVTRHIDHEAIRRLVADGGTQTLLEDIVRMVTAQERLLAQFAQTALPGQPELARELQQRASQLSIRFRMALTSAGMTAAVRQAGLGRAPEPE